MFGTALIVPLHISTGDGALFLNISYHRFFSRLPRARDGRFELHPLSCIYILTAMSLWSCIGKRRLYVDMKKYLFIVLIIGLFCSCASDENKAKNTVKKYFTALSHKDTKTAYELFPNSNPKNYGNIVTLKGVAYTNPEITAVKQKGNTYEVDFKPAACLYVEKNGDGDFVITDSRNFIDVQNDNLNSQYNIAYATGAINDASTDIHILKAEDLIKDNSEFFNFLKKKYNKYYNGDFKVLSNKKDKIGNAVFVKVTYQTSIDAHEHAVVVNGKDKDGNVIVTKQKKVDWLDAGHINSVTLIINGEMINYIKDYEVNIGLFMNHDPIYWLAYCGAPFSRGDYKEFLNSKK